MEKTSLGIDENIESLLCYVLGWVSGLVFFLLEKDNRTVKFHAVQSMVVFGALSAVQIVLSMMRLYFVLPVIGLLGLVLWILLMVKAYQGERFKLPIAGDIAEKNS
jgi:uncharacterized membrane protein